MEFLDYQIHSMRGGVVVVDLDVQANVTLLDDIAAVCAFGTPVECKIRRRCGCPCRLGIGTLW
jgi:hypothetical protein